MRLSHPTIRPAARTVTLLFDGSPVPALEGETVAAALSAAGIVAFRRTASGAPRGLYCGMGACFDCVVTIDGRIGQRACLAKVADGMEISGSAPAVLAPLAPPPATPASQERGCDVLVVGAGPAGLSAALAAAEAGAAVVVLDEREAAGGQYLKPLAASHADSLPDRQFREGSALRERVRAAGVAIHTGATVWGAFGAAEIAAVVDGVAITFRPRCLVLAPGAHERPVPIPGWTLPGVMTTGALQTLARAQRVSPGQRVLVAGNGPLNLQLACELIAGGVEVAAVVEAAPRPGTAVAGSLWRMLRTAPTLARQGRAYLAALRKARVEILWGSRVVSLEGAERFEEARVQTPAGDRYIAASVVALNLGFQPETGLARALDVPHRFVDIGLGHLATEADTDGRTAVAGVFAVGDGASLGGARVALARGRLAGLAAARDLGFAAPEDTAIRQALARAEAFQTALWTVFRPPPPDRVMDATIVCRCEEVTAGRLREEIAGGLVSLPALKKATRAGMGRCQGRFCAATIARLCPQAPTAEAFAAPRVPVKPVPAAALMFEQPEFAAPLLTAPTPPARRVAVPTLPIATRHCEVLVIGGGCVGLSTAYYLARDGADVIVADRDEAGLAASTANAGSLHVQLLSYDFRDDTPEDGGPAAHTLPIAPRSIALWKEIAEASGETLGIATPGGLMLADSDTGMAWLRAKAAMEARWGIESHVIGANELRTLAPALSDGMVGAVFCPAEGRIDPLRGTMALARLAQLKGARLLRGAAVVSVAREGESWLVETTKGRVVAGRVVNAGGPWGGRIGAMVGLDLPITGTVQQVIVTEPAPRLVEHLVAYAHRHLSLKQQDSGGLLIGGGWFGRYDAADGRTRNLRASIEGNLWVAAQVLPALRGLSIVRSWTGINTADRPRADPGRGAGPARLLERADSERLHARPGLRQDHGRRDSAWRRGRSALSGGSVPLDPRTPMPRVIDYYLTTTSPWTYLGHDAFMAIAAKHGAAVRFKPTSFRAVFGQTGGLALPQRHPVRQRYRLVELQRWRERRGLPLNLHPAHWPFDQTALDCLVIAADIAGLDTSALLRRAFAMIWAEQRDVGDPATLAELAAGIGLAGDILADVQAGWFAPAYEANLDAALAGDVFGAPSYVVDGEVFWGQDRLDLLDAMLASDRPAYRS